MVGTGGQLTRPFEEQGRHLLHITLDWYPQATRKRATDRERVVGTGGQLTRLFEEQGRHLLPIIVDWYPPGTRERATDWNRTSSENIVLKLIMSSAAESNPDLFSWSFA